MKIDKIKKVMAISIVSLVATALFSFAPGASAWDGHHGWNVGSGDPPKLWSINEVSDHSVVLPVEYNRLRGSSALFIVSIKDMRTGFLKEEQTTAVLSPGGKIGLNVSGLASQTPYEFKVRVIKPWSGCSTTNSSVKGAVTF